MLKDSTLFHHNFFKFSGKESVVGLVAFANEMVHFAIEKQEKKPDMFLKFYRLSEEKYSKMAEEIFEIVKGSQFLHLD